MGAKQGKYEGETKNGKRHGWGICAFQDRSYYEGEWVDDKMDGEGKYVRPDGSTYEGYWESNLQNGFGRLCLSNGDVYEGDFRDGKMDGYGTYFYKNGSIYDGEFIEDEAHGLGTFKGVNGEFYQGEWQVDKMHGVGVYRFAGGAKFRGEWKYGKMDGYGIYENLDRDQFMGKFEGQFLEGKMDGLGLYYWPEGDIFMGEYAQDKRHGTGIYTSVKGAVYKGEYITGERHGWAEYTSPQGDVYEGQWRHNVRHGKGVVTLAEPDEGLLNGVVEGGADDQRKWAELWFKDSPARPQDTGGNVLEIDPTRVYTGYWNKGKVKSKRPYRYEDWNDIQANSTIAADNAALAVEETQKAVGLARKSSEFAEQSAKDTVKKMQGESETKQAYFVHVKNGNGKREVEDKHFVRFGPQVTNNTFLLMLGPMKAAEMSANKDDVIWLASATGSGAGGTGPMSGEVEALMSPTVVAWIARASKRSRKDAHWHVKRPQPTARPLPAQTASSAHDIQSTPRSTAWGRIMASPGAKNSKMNQNADDGSILSAAVHGNAPLKKAMQAVREEGEVVKAGGSLISLVPRPPRHPPKQGGNAPNGNPLPSIQGSPRRPNILSSVQSHTEHAKENVMATQAPQARVPSPPSKPANSITSAGSRASRMSSRFAGGGPLPPRPEQLAKMQAKNQV